MLPYLLAILTKPGPCSPGSATCEDSLLFYCNQNGKWIGINCEEGSRCSLSENAIMCVKNELADMQSKSDGKESEKGKKDEGEKNEQSEGEKTNTPEKSSSDDQGSGKNDTKDSQHKESGDKKEDEKGDTEKNDAQDKENPQKNKGKDKSGDKKEKKAKCKEKKVKKVKKDDDDDSSSTEYIYVTKVAKPKVQTIEILPTHSCCDSKVTVYKTVTKHVMPEEIKVEVSHDGKGMLLNTPPMQTSPHHASPAQISKFLMAHGIETSQQKGAGPGQGGGNSAAKGNKSSAGSNGGSQGSGGTSGPAKSGSEGSCSSKSGGSSSSGQSGGAKSGGSSSSGQSSGSRGSSGAKSGGSRGSSGAKSGGSSSPGQSGGGGSSGAKSGGGASSGQSGGGGSTSSGSGGSSAAKSSGGSSSAKSGDKKGATPSGGQTGGPSSGGGSGGGSSQSSGGSQDKKSGSKPSAGGQGGGGAGITVEELKEALTANGMRNESGDALDSIVESVNETLESKEEAAMFIAQCMHESEGFMYTEEIACKDNPESCAQNYWDDAGVEGKSYHGRGYIQLSWPANYKAASEGLGMGDELLNNPELVAEDPKIAIATAIWFWVERVRPAGGVEKKQFGLTTEAINGPLECGGGSDVPAKRYEIYKKVAEAFGVSDIASEEGC